MMLLIALLCLSLQGPAPVTAVNKALQFGSTANDYMKFSPDMDAFTNAFSVCTWIKNMRQAPPSRLDLAPMVFDYGDHDILISGNGYWNLIFRDVPRNVQLVGKFTAPIRTWYHCCTTWSSASDSYKIYVDGNLAGMRSTTPGKTIPPGKELTLGITYYLGANYLFGGQITKLNIFSKEMTEEEVKAIADAGICSSIEDDYGDTRALKWESILEEPKNGRNVYAVEIEQCEEEDDNFKEEQLKKALEQLKKDKAACEEGTKQLQKELQESEGDRNTLQEQLDAVKAASVESGNKFKEELQEIRAAITEGNIKLQEELKAMKAAIEDGKTKAMLEAELEKLKEELDEKNQSECPGEGIWSVPRNLIGKTIKKKMLNKWKKDGENDNIRYLSAWKGVKLTKDLARYIECFQTKSVKKSAEKVAE